jgi:endonuclease/exonuclease/phosphatase (EEP) superfamily protein YafD
MQLRCVTFNVLADAYLGYGDYSQVAPRLMVPGARLPHLLRCIANLDADVVAIQEAELPLVAALEKTGDWDVFWSQKHGNGRDKPDGCLLLTRLPLAATGFKTYGLGDESGHIAQSVRVRGVTLANTHIKWAPEGSPYHVGVQQMRQLLRQLHGVTHAVIFSDCNDVPRGPVRECARANGFSMLVPESVPTALVNGQLDSLDIIAARGVMGKYVATDLSPRGVPTEQCPSDHIPLVVNIQA